MKKLTGKQLNHMAKLIKDEVSFFNGWSVSELTIDQSCLKAATQVEKYLRRVNKKALAERK